jgi:predicted transcriptional regulator
VLKEIAKNAKFAIFLKFLLKVNAKIIAQLEPTDKDKNVYHVEQTVKHVKIHSYAQFALNQISF